MHNIQDFSDKDLIDELNDRGYEKRERHVKLDYKDKQMLNEIMEAFVNSNWAERDKIYKKVFKNDK